MDILNKLFDAPVYLCEIVELTKPVFSFKITKPMLILSPGSVEVYFPIKSSLNNLNTISMSCYRYTETYQAMSCPCYFLENLAIKSMLMRYIVLSFFYHYCYTFIHDVTMKKEYVA